MATLKGLESLSRTSRSFHNYNLVILGSSRGVKGFKRFSEPCYKIGIGDLPLRAPKLGPYDLWVTANTSFPQPFNDHHIQLMLNSNCKNVLLSTIAWNNSGHVVNKEDLVKLQANSRIGFYFFDQRHFGGEPCQPKNNCCLIYYYLDVPITLQELLLQSFLNATKTYGTGHTVAVHALAVALLMRPKRIYLFGVDLPQHSRDYKYYNRCAKIDRSYLGNLKYFYGFLRSRRSLPDSSPFGGEVRKELLDDFQTLFLLASELGIEVFVGGKKSSLLDLEGVLRLQT